MHFVRLACLSLFFLLSAEIGLAFSGPPLCCGGNCPRQTLIIGAGSATVTETVRCELGDCGCAGNADRCPCDRCTCPRCLRQSCESRPRFFHRARGRRHH